jgi:hypothetical protein
MLKKTRKDVGYSNQVYFNSGQKNEYKNKISKIIKDLLDNPVEIGNSYIPSPTTKNEEKLPVDSNVLFKKLKRSSIKLNVNISNNYYNSGVNNEEEVVDDMPTEAFKNTKSEERPSRFTVFLSIFIFFYFFKILI